MKKESLCIFTSAYPFGSAETFLEPELNLLSSHYNKIHLFPLVKPEKSVTRNLPENVVVHEPYSILRVSKMKMFSFSVMKLTLKEFFYCRKKSRFLKNMRSLITTLLQCQSRSERLIQEHDELIEKSDNYIYWMEDWATTFSFIKKKSPSLFFLGRVHGYDLFENRNKLGFIPWRKFQFENANKVIAVSKAGMEYLKKKHPGFAEKFDFSYLGVSGNFPMQIPSHDSIPLIVSCSAVIPLKRVDKIAKSLVNLNISLRWIHFGGGEGIHGLKQITESIAFSNIEIVLTGNVSQDFIFNFYKENAVSMFVHMSETEGGVPLAIQEAVAHGIPVLACNAGGVGEIINEQTGRLLSVNFQGAEFKKAFDFIIDHASYDAEFRKNIQSFWTKNFSLDRSIERFLSFFNH